VYRRADETAHAQRGLLALHLLARAALAAASRCVAFFLGAHVAATLLAGSGAVLFQPAVLAVWHQLALAFGAILPLAAAQLLAPADEAVARHLPSKYEITTAQVGALSKAMALVVLPTLLCVLFVFASCFVAVWPGDAPFATLFGAQLDIESIDHDDALSSALVNRCELCFIAYYCVLMCFSLS
jgi:hypothetical protein